MWRKSNFYEQSARVPLQLRWPGVLPEGERTDGVVSLVDVTAALSDYRLRLHDRDDTFGELAGNEEA